MSLQHVSSYYPDASEKACVEIGLQYIKVPNDGKYHPARLINNPSGCFAGEIVISPNGDCGFAYNRKTTKRVFFVIPESFLSIKPKQKEVKKPRKISNPIVSLQIQAIKAMLSSGEQ